MTSPIDAFGNITPFSQLRDFLMISFDAGMLNQAWNIFYS